MYSQYQTRARGRVHIPQATITLCKYSRTCAIQGRRNRGATGARAPLSLQQVVVNKLLNLTISLSVESDNTQLLHTLLELTSGVRYLNNSNISLTVN